MKFISLVDFKLGPHAKKFMLCVFFLLTMVFFILTMVFLLLIMIFLRLILVFILT